MAARGFKTPCLPPKNKKGLRIRKPEQIVHMHTAGSPPGRVMMGMDVRRAVHEAKLSRAPETAKTDAAANSLDLQPTRSKAMHRILSTTLVALLAAVAPAAQPRLPEGVWEAGGAGRIVQITAPSGPREARVRLESELVMVDLHPGFAVVKAEYRFRNPSDAPSTLMVGIPSGGHFPLDTSGRAVFSDLRSYRILANGDTVAPTHSNPDAMTPIPGYDSVMPHRYLSWTQRFDPGETTVTVYLLTRNHLSRLVREGSASDGNAFGYAFNGDRGWPGGTGMTQVLVRLNGELYLTGLRAVLPDSAFSGNLRHLRTVTRGDSTGRTGNMLIWYEGAAPDFKFDRKVLPAADTLYRIMDDFPLDEFDGPGFQPVSRMNLHVAKTGITPAGIAYFIMFFLPWVVLLFIIFQLLRKGKKEKTASKGTGHSPAQSNTLES